MFSLQAITRERCYLQQELDRAVKSVKAKKSIIILGPEKMGKSSFMLHVSSNLPNNFTPIIVSAEGCVTINDFVRRNLGGIFSAFSGLFGKDAKELLSLSFLDADRRISVLKLSDEAKQKLKLLLFFENDPKISLEEVIAAFFDLPKVLASEAKSAACVFVDDAHLLAGIKSDKTSLSSYLDLLKSGTDRESVFVVSSSLPMQLGGFEEIHLRPLTIDSARQLMADNALEMDEPAITTLYNITEGVPFYLNFFGRILSMSGVKDHAGIEKMVSSSLENELHMYYSEKVKLLSPKELPILFCMAEHRVNTPSRIGKLLNYSQTNVRRFLSIMEEKGFVTLKDRGVFEIHDPVFRRWLEGQSRR
ncbi:hypothetical protein KY363_08440, partial [Candidatus Woesearchaeota archaeon]|nr:hypothetical protein [Candidatus Woesearchaeota archaeon]